MEENSHSLLENRRQVIGNIVFIVLLIVAFPLGVIMMWLRYKTWPSLAKVLFTFLPIYIFLTNLFLYSFFTTFESDWKYGILKDENIQLKQQIDKIKHQMENNNGNTQESIKIDTFK